MIPDLPLRLEGAGELILFISLQAHQGDTGGKDPGGLLRQMPFVEVGAHLVPVGIPL